MKSCLVTVLYNTPPADVERLRCQAKVLGIQGFDLEDNSISGRGYAEGVNRVLQRNAGKYDVFFIANPDIDISGLDKGAFMDPARKLDVWGYAMNQDGKTYYGGEIDRWRMSGGLVTQRPDMRFSAVDFISGSFIAVTSETIEKIGLLDERFGMYYEDVEYCLRARRDGLRVGIDSENAYVHFETSQENPAKARMLARSRLRFLWNHGSWQQKTYELLRLPKTLWEDGKHLL